MGILSVTLALAVLGDAPKVVSLEPENRASDVDPKKTTRLVATFDRDMSPAGWSFCGGGPEFPKFKGTPRWETPKKIVVEVELQPDHQYRMSLNCPAASNFKSKEGVALAPVPWSFGTGPEKAPDPAKQKAENRKSWEALQKTLAESYSYYDLRVHAWDKLYHEHEAAVLGAKTAMAWASEVAKMLAPTEDIHMHLKLGDQFFAVGTRAIDPLYREATLSKYVQLKPAVEKVLQGRTNDGVGYVMIPGWDEPKTADAAEEALAKLHDCKAMVVDVRPNCGGDELLARRVAAWFVDGTKVYGKDRFRVRAGKDGFGPVLDRALDGNKDAAKRIDAPVAVLTSRYVMSSNESFVLMMKQAKDCTVVGQTTYGSSGCPKAHALPNGVTIVLPSWQDLRLDGTCFESEGLAPDVEVTADAADFVKSDPILARALELLRAKIQ